jgi:hypothetical protein
MIKHNANRRYDIDPDFFSLNEMPERTLMHKVILKAMEDAIMPPNPSTFRHPDSKRKQNRKGPVLQTQMECRQEAYEWITGRDLEMWAELVYDDGDHACHLIRDFVEEWRERVRNGAETPHLIYQKRKRCYKKKKAFVKVDKHKNTL